MRTQWKTEWPTEPGLYWFYGFPYGLRERDAKIDLSLVRAVKNGQGSITCIREGHFFYKSEGAIGKFIPVELPELPV